ncbi:class I SAM-dependent methyltransferase [Streptococcus loxodontisalivarius]|uniref:Ubiquinone/menaquinone biosynthesis C-methylase UbiE n=1 Tax=Streptococcus loxodontisalivarius TaxID=1349415 RepID=A0ABS2PTM4_9STRE|nr:class I SAM-dependent methyltransferase [Streptococcus loxodontisalivarius]MBM7643392.1 ubiquinone/menaquinone biosynthesis C-methylase UbiE [Streptococcus loxodontisalivarius]
MHNRDTFTQSLLAASIKKGMTVLDLGCGTGDVTFLAADLVGETGSVLGLDISQPMLDMAEERLTQTGQTNISFQKLDLEQLDQLDRTFDLILARRVLMYLPGPAQTLSLAKQRLKEGGLMVFQESDALGRQLNPDFPQHSRAIDLIWRTVAAEGGDIEVGSKLYTLLKEQGMEILSYQSENVLQTQESGSDLAWVLDMMQDRIIKHQIASKEDLEEIRSALPSELAQSKKAFIRDTAFGIIARK